MVVSIISIPFPTHRLASSALLALQVDAELSPLVYRSFSLTTPDIPVSTSDPAPQTNGSITRASSTVEVKSELSAHRDSQVNHKQTLLRTEYKATTNRMLRVAVNGFMESLGVVLSVMEELDVDVLTKGKS